MVNIIYLVQSFILFSVTTSQHLATSEPPKREVVLFWGQNTARLPERSLDYFCDSGSYDVIVVSYVTEFFASEITRYPGMNLAVHCGVLPNKAYPGLFSCGGIENAIKKCQSKNIKVLLGIRSESGPKWLQKKGDGEFFANRIWDLFLGGTRSPSLRPFGNAVMDGINLSIRVGTDKHYDEMLDQFNSLYATDRGRDYLITASPSCGLPLSDFKTVIDDRPQYFDAIYLQHDYSVDCHPTGPQFLDNLDKWTKKIRAMNGITFKKTKFYIVIVLSLELKYYMTLWSQFKPIYENTLQDIPEFGGVCLADAGWDDRLHVKPHDKRYSALLHQLFNPITATTRTPVSTTTARPTPKPLNLKVGALWGSNIAKGTTGNTEPSLRIVCEKALYDTIIINTLDDDANDQNKGNLPGLNFASHCYTPFGPDYKTYFRCNTMGSDIAFCQRKNIKVLLNIGGSTRFIGFGNKNESQVFAHMIWKLFLGGVADATKELLPRTFGRVVLDGVNIEVRFGQAVYFVDFVRELRILMDRSSDKRQYLITANPNCVHPSFILDESFQKRISAFDHLFVNFDDQQCNINRKANFESAFQRWYDYAIKLGGPKIWVGLPSDPRNTRDSQLYLPRLAAKDKFENLAKLYPKFGGVLLNDVSWDFENPINGVLYSQSLAGVLRPGRIPGREKVVTEKPKTTFGIGNGKKTKRNPDDKSKSKDITPTEFTIVRIGSDSTIIQANVMLFGLVSCVTFIIM